MNLRLLLNTRFAIVCSTLLLSACSPATLLSRGTQPLPRPTVPIDTPAENQLLLRDYDAAVMTIRNTYLDEVKVGKTWQAVADEQRQALIKAEPERSQEQFFTSIRQTIDALGDVDLSIQANSATTSTFGGIGVQVDLPAEGKNRVLILAVFPNSPAARAGLKPHDAIVAVDGKAVDAAEGGKVIERIVGEPDTKVSLTVRTPGGSERDVMVTRKVIEQDPQNTPIDFYFIKGTDIAYIAPNPVATDEMADEVAAAMRTLAEEKPLQGLVLDLRLMRINDFPIDQMLTLFVNGEQVGNLQVRRTQEKLGVAGKNIAGSQRVPLTILISDLTRGQAEAFAGLLQDLGRAKLIGSTTRGSTAVISKVNLPVSGLELNVPSGEYRSHTGRSWYRTGLIPSVLYETQWEDYNAEDDPLIPLAVESLGK